MKDMTPSLFSGVAAGREEDMAPASATTFLPIHPVSIFYMRRVISDTRLRGMNLEPRFLPFRRRRILLTGRCRRQFNRMRKSRTHKFPSVILRAHRRIERTG